MVSGLHIFVRLIFGELIFIVKNIMKGSQVRAQVSTSALHMYACMYVHVYLCVGNFCMPEYMCYTYIHIDLPVVISNIEKKQLTVVLII